MIGGAVTVPGLEGVVPTGVLVAGPDVDPIGVIVAGGVVVLPDVVGATVEAEPDFFDPPPPPPQPAVAITSKQARRA
jgi:hypothetical protein